jgi:5-methylcytosine-specific restriction enzyme A
MFVQGQTYVRQDLHRQYGGQGQGGISTPSRHKFIMLFTGDQGEQYGYRDGWTSDGGIFLYTGEGQVGDMKFDRGNRAVRDHIPDQKDLHLFEYVQTGRVRYIGQMVYAGHQIREAPDRNGNLRNVIVFELNSITAFDQPATTQDTQEAGLWEEGLQDLRQKALSLAADTRTPQERLVNTRLRSAAIKIYVLKRSGGKCESCGLDAPFITEAGRQYLEPHHIRRLSDGGPDHPEWVAAVCPNCHRRAHYSRDKNTFNARLIDIVKEREMRLTQDCE